MNSHLLGRFNRISLCCDSPFPSFPSMIAICLLFLIAVANCYFPLSDDECKVSDPQTSNVYNLWPLRKNDVNYVYDDVDGKYYVNICGTLADSDAMYPCNKDAGACLKKKSGDGQVGYNLGKPHAKSLELIGNNQLKYTFTDGDSCASDASGTVLRKTILILNCDKSSSEKGPQLVKSDDKCVHHFVWNTKHACPQSRGKPGSGGAGSKDCVFTSEDGKRKYDLSLLTRSNTDYFVQSGKDQFYLNVCHATNDVTEEEVGKDNAAAKSTVDKPKEYVSLGRLSTLKVTIAHDILVYEVSMGSTCPGTTKSYSMRINFVCDHEVDIGRPRFVSGGSDCSYLFTWATKHACPVGEVNENHCTVRTPKGIADLNPLRKDNGEFYESHYKTDKFLFNFCSPLAESSENSCKDNNASICLKSSTSSVLGRKGKLTFDEDIFKMVYEDGDVCNDGNSRKQAIIKFSCDSMAHTGSEVPHLVHSIQQCYYYFDMKTNLVCDENLMPDRSNGYGDGRDGGGKASGGVNGWMVFFWIVFSLVLTYFVGGVLYKRYVLGFTGLDQIPNIDFWLKVIDFLRCRRSPEYSISLG